MKKIAVLTSGGDAPGMNACIRAAVRFGLSKNMEMYGVMRGYEGLLKGDIFRMFRHSVTDIIQRGGTILKTARSERFFDEEGRKEARDRLAALGIEGLVVIGGDGSFNGAAKLACETDIKVACIPGTIDNDLNYTDYTLGFDTAVNTVLNAVNNIRDTMSSHDRVCIVEVMGRSCGDIALFSAIGGGADAVVTPEKGLDLDALAAQLKQGEKLGKSSNIILLSEGVCSAQSLKEQLAAVTDMTLRTVTLGSRSERRLAFVERQTACRPFRSQSNRVSHCGKKCGCRGRKKRRNRGGRPAKGSCLSCGGQKRAV